MGPTRGPVGTGENTQGSGAIPHTSLRDVGEGVVGAFGIALAFLTPMLRGFRSHWGLDPELATRVYPGDDLVPTPRWSWTHGVEIDAPADWVWPWVAQMGVDKGGFYSYAFLENLVGCELENADRVHPEWSELEPEDLLFLHPEMPPMPVVAVEPGRWFVARAWMDLDTAEEPSEGGTPDRFMNHTWLFFVEPLPGRRCRFISRWRADYCPEVAMRLAYGPTTLEPVGFVMDRRMLLGVKERAEAAWRDRPYER